MTNSETLVFKIGDIRLGLKVEPGWIFAPQRRFSDFSTSETPQAIYQVALNPAHGRPGGSIAFDSGQAWRLFADGDRRIIWAGSRDFDPYLVGNFSADYLSGEIFITPSRVEADKNVFPLGYPLGEVLMTNLLGTGYGIMLHSCGVIDSGNGIVFAGTSTAGKTTTARLWNNLAGVRVLNDDHTILRNRGGLFRVYGTPWHGEGGIALAKDAPLRKIFILKHAPSNQAVRLSPEQAAAALLVRTFPPLWSMEGMAFTLQFLDELCQAVPCYELGFVPDQSAVEYVRCLTSE